MIRETYKGRKLKAVEGKGSEYGYTRVTIGKSYTLKYMGKAEKALASVRGTIDHADEVGAGSARYAAEWYAPGTFELCDNGHTREIGGLCRHSYCAERHLAAVLDEAYAEQAEREQVAPEVVADEVIEAAYAENEARYVEAQAQAEPVSFGDVSIGDRLVFATRDNGFGGTGDLIDRTGVVTSATEKTITVKLDNPTPVRAFEGGKTRTYGLTARLRVADWYGRSVRRIAKAVAAPATPEQRMISKRVAGGYYKVHTPLGTWTIDHFQYGEDEKRVGMRDKWVLLYPGEHAPDADAAKEAAKPKTPAQKLAAEGLATLQMPGKFADVFANYNALTGAEDHNPLSKKVRIAWENATKRDYAKGYAMIITAEAQVLGDIRQFARDFIANSSGDGEFPTAEVNAAYKTAQRATEAMLSIRNNR